MKRHIWRAADTGVMLWQPAVEAITPTELKEPHPFEQPHTVTGADIQGKWLLAILPCVYCEGGTDSWEAFSGSNHDDNEHELVLPSIEDFIGSYIKNEPEEDIDRVSSSTLDHCIPNTLSLSPSSPVFSKPVRRVLDFTMVAQPDIIDVPAQTTKPSNLKSLAALRKLERDPPHHWDEDERELLTILYRWYEDADVTTIPKVFNAVTGLDLRLSVVRYQFESHLILYGGLAYPEFDRVMKVPFHDPEQKYNGIHAIIKETATEFGIDLSRRRVEVKHKSGLAKVAKSPRTRKYYKSLVRRAAKREKDKAYALEIPASQELPLRVLPHGGITLATDPRREDDESWSDIDDWHTSPVTPTETSPRVSPGTQPIAFRVWDANSRTKFDDETGFVSQAFSIWRGEFPPPFSPDGQGRQALMLLTNLHLSMSGGASAFVSLSTSLLQALVKASTMDKPRIAVGMYPPNQILVLH
jgi:hypothetical protein